MNAAARWPAVFACLLFALALALWFAIVMPVNAELALWTRNVVAPNAEDVRMRWEGGHVAIAFVKLLGFIALATAVSRFRATGFHTSAVPQPEPVVEAQRADASS